MGGLWFCSVNLFTNILIIVSVDLLIYTKYHTWINVAILLVVTFISYIIFLAIVHNMSMFNSVGTIREAFFSGRMWMNMIFVGGFCALIDFSILGIQYIFCPSTANIMQILLNQNVNMDKDYPNELPKQIRDKIEQYNDFKVDDNDNNLKKETTQKNIKENEELKLRPKNYNTINNSSNSNSGENGGVINDKNNKINDLDNNGKDNIFQKDNDFIENKLTNKKNNNQDNKTFSIENSNNFLEGKKNSEKKNANINLKKDLNKDNKAEDLLINDDNNLNLLNNDEDNHSQSALIHNNKGKVDGINSSPNK